MDYLHYYLIHSPETMSFVHAIELGKRQELIDRQIETLKLRDSYIASSAQGIEEIGQIWDELTGETNILKSSFEDNPPQTLTLSLGGHTLSNLSKHGAAELAAEIGKDVDKLQEMTTEFSSALLRTLDEVYTEVSSDGNFEQFRREIIEEYRKNKGLKSTSNIQEQILKDFLSSDGIVALNGYKGNGKYGSTLNSLAKLTLLAEALPEYAGQHWSYGYNSTKNESHHIGKLSTFFQIIGRKMGSLVNNVNGLLGEVTNAYGMEVATQKVNEKLSDAGLTDSRNGNNSNGVTFTQEIVGSKTVKGSGFLDWYCNPIYDRNLQYDIRLQSYHVSKADTQITITKDGASITFGATVKNYREPKNTNKTRHFNIQSNTPFLAAFLNVYPGQEDYLYQFAGGHAYDESNEESLNKAWRDMVSIVVAGNALNALAGLPKENVMYFVAGKNVWTISEIMKNIQETYSEADSGRATNKGMSVSISRGGDIYAARQKVTLELNKWKGSENRDDPSKTLGRERSSEAAGKIAQHLYMKKISFQLNVLSSFMK